MAISISKAAQALGRLGGKKNSKEHLARISRLGVEAKKRKKAEEQPQPDY
jgi:phosphotransferase system IIB component